MSEDPRIAALERENAKLRKINRVLMERIERDMDLQGNAFSLFQTAIVLEGKVRERTTALETALHDLGQANFAAETARLFLHEAIESINEGFLLCDADDRVVLGNSRYQSLWDTKRVPLCEGQTFADLTRRAALSGQVEDSAADPEGWIARRLASHRAPGEPFVLRMTGGRWLQVSERRTKDGGIVGLYTDITEIKLTEERRRERELAEKSVLLQSSLDSLAQGVSVFDRERRLVVWNQRFIDLLGGPPPALQVGTPLSAFRPFAAMAAQEGPNVKLSLERETPAGRVVEIMRNPMPDGGFVTTYTDITQRKRSEEALKDSERRIRLVTDAMPALIAYVDADRIYRFTNKGYENWFGRPRDTIDGHPMRDVLGPALYDMRADYVDLVLQGQECHFEMTMPVGPTGVHYAMATYVPHFGPDGQVLGFFALIQDITERRQAAEELREAKASLERRVEERTRQLQTATIEAQQANQSKTRFLAAAGHDLLQPLNAARLYASALTERRLSAQNRAMARQTLISLDAVDGLLGALLDISKLDAGVQTVDRTTFRLGDLCDQLSREYGLLATKRQITLKRIGPSATVESDPRLLGRILRNYLSNALRYTPSGGRVLLGTRRRNDRILVGVWDSGPGIPPDKQEEIFEEFRRLDSNADSGDQGMGLGLAIVRRIARMLDHPLVLRSVPGQGSLFGVELPISRENTPQSLLPPPRRVEQAAAGPLKNARILVIDNEPRILDAMCTLLEGWGCAPIAAKDLRQAKDRLGDAPPDLIIADYHLNDGAVGLDVIMALRHQYGPTIPAIIATADFSDEVRQQSRAQGCHLLNKPLRHGKLRSLLAHLLGARPPKTDEGHRGP